MTLYFSNSVFLHLSFSEVDSSLLGIIMKILILLSVLLSCFLIEGKFHVAYQWKSLNFNKLEQRTGEYNLTHPVPFGIARHGNRMFVGLARRNFGIPFTLAYFNLNQSHQGPHLTPYPSVLVNTVGVSCRKSRSLLIIRRLCFI